MKSPYPHLICALVLFSPASVRAATIYSTLGQSVDQVNNFGDVTWRWASDFRTGNATSTITTATLAMTNNDNIVHHFTFAIFIDDSGRPGTLVDAFDEELILPGAYFRVNVSAKDAGIDLAANTIYWFVVKMNEKPNNAISFLSSTDSSVADAGSFSSPVASTHDLVSFDGGATYSTGIPGNFVLALEGAIVVPEPTSITLLVVGASAIALRLRRKRTGV